LSDPTAGEGRHISAKRVFGFLIARPLIADAIAALVGVALAKGRGGDRGGGHDCLPHEM
jgi:hypothetical protein